MQFLASQYDYHNQLCKRRYNTKKKTDKIDRRFMDIFGKITMEISALTKTSKVSSAIISKRNFLDGMTSNKSMPINSPLITNKGMNNLEDISKIIMEKNKTSTPAMTSRTGALDFAKQGQFQMNKIVRKDVPLRNREEKGGKSTDWNNPLQIRSLENRPKGGVKTTKPPLPKEKKEESLPLEQKSESKINTTTETTPDSKELDKRKFTVAPKDGRNKEEEKTLPKDFMIPEDVKEAINNRSTVSFTPGINKRRLTRDTNNTIGERAKFKMPIEPLPVISMTKPKPTEKEAEISEKPNKKVDPLRKLPKKQNEGENKVQTSLNFLKQFGASPSANQMKEKKHFESSDPPVSEDDLRLVKKSMTVTPRRLEKKEDSESNGSQSLK